MDDAKVSLLRPGRGASRALTADLVAGRLREHIIAGWVRRGQVLTLRETAASIGAPLALTRDAFSRLHHDGFLIRTSRGSAVAPLCLEAQQLLTRRLPLEVQLTRLATRRLGAFGLNLLRRISGEMVEAQRRYDLPNAQRHNYRFHIVLYRFADRPDMLAEVQTLWAGFPFDLMTTMPSRLPAVAEEHETVLAALCQGDPGEAARAMHYHILHGWQEFRRHYPLRIERQTRVAPNRRGF